MNYYEMLGVSPTANTTEIEQAIDARYNYWRALVTHHDPNKVNQANQELQKLETIRGTLMDANKRAKYDAAIGIGNTIGGLVDPIATTKPPISPPSPPPPPRRRAATDTAFQRTDVWECSRCKTPNPPNTHFCEKCGNTLGKDCPNCAKLIKAAATFCPHCGKNLAQAAHEKRVRAEEAEKQKQLFTDTFANLQWEIMPQLLEQAKRSEDFYFDIANLIEIDQWSKGRVVLVGDAGYPTPLTAWGVSLALIGAYILAGELKTAGGDYRTAFEAYEREFRPFVEQKTKEARRTGLRLVPGSALGLWMRNQVMKLFSIPAVSRLAARMTYGRMFRESFALKDYEVLSS
ncbi:hypothetical protein FBQ82_21745 [Anaerolineae bacterium CFX7]|nr:hypothetical protein [Anaerolineae bacterium CFX7]